MLTQASRCVCMLKRSREWTTEIEVVRERDKIPLTCNLTWSLSHIPFYTSCQPLAIDSSEFQLAFRITGSQHTFHKTKNYKQNCSFLSSVLCVRACVISSYFHLCFVAHVLLDLYLWNRYLLLRLCHLSFWNTFIFRVFFI